MGYNRIHLDGGLGSNIERWSVSWATQLPAGGSEDDASELATWAEAIRTAFAGSGTWQTDLKGMWGAATTLTGVRVYHYDVPGGDATALGVSTGASVSGAGSITLPFQSSLVLTLRTNRPGRSFRGRLYWPFLTGTLSSSGQTGNTTTQQAHADAFKAMFAAVSAAGPGGSGWVPSIASAATGQITPVSQVRLGNVIDTQRRRSHSIPESFVQASIP